MNVQRKNQTAAVAKKTQCKEWLDFLLAFSMTPQNRELAREFFIEEFTESPRMFYQFLSFFERQLTDSARTKKQRREIAKKYIDILLSLSERFGFFGERDNLSDMCLKVLDLRGYKKIETSLHRYQRKSQKLINTILKILQKLIDSEGYNGSIRGRYKSIYSIYKKMQLKVRQNIFQLKDIFAFRIILEQDSPEQCFEMLNLLHDRFTPIAIRFKDYITIPKINGYQSLHTGLTNVIPDLDLPIEVQIRTRVMDDCAEKGFAAHHLYSQHKKSQLLSKKEKMMIEHLTFLTKSQSRSLYCFSQKGDIFRLSEKTTFLDFAYLIHTELGNKARAALANGEKKKLSDPIPPGAKIRILTSPHRQVNLKWLEYTQDKNTQRKISAALKT